MGDMAGLPCDPRDLPTALRSSCGGLRRPPPSCPNLPPPAGRRVQDPGSGTAQRGMMAA